jgi:hypothetical protein
VAEVAQDTPRVLVAQEATEVCMAAQEEVVVRLGMVSIAAKGEMGRMD